MDTGFRSQNLQFLLLVYLTAQAKVSLPNWGPKQFTVKNVIKMLLDQIGRGLQAKRSTSTYVME